jgi:hypothetical protein
MEDEIFRLQRASLPWHCFHYSAMAYVAVNQSRPVIPPFQAPFSSGPKLNRRKITISDYNARRIEYTSNMVDIANIDSTALRLSSSCFVKAYWN